MTLVLWLRLGGRPRINKVAPVYNPGERAANPPKAGKSLGGQTRHWGETMTRGLDPNLVTTAFELPGYRIVRNMGVVRGVVVRSRSLFGTMGGALQTLVGGNISLFTELCEKTRQDAYDLMLEHAAERGANAVVGMRYDANEVMNGVTEVLAYGSAVQVERQS